MHGGPGGEGGESSASVIEKYFSQVFFPTNTSVRYFLRNTSVRYFYAAAASFK